MGLLVVLVEIVTLIIMATYSYLSIRGKTNTWAWHLMQWASYIGAALFGYLLCVWVSRLSFTFHNFGNVTAWLVTPSVFTYIITLRLLQRERR